MTTKDTKDTKAKDTPAEPQPVNTTASTTPFAPPVATTRTTGDEVTQHPGFVRAGDVGADGKLAVGTTEKTPENTEHPAEPVPEA